MPRPTRLPDAALQRFLAEPPSWQIVDGMLTRTFDLPSYAAGISFVVAIGFAAEKIDHHPDLAVTFKRVRVALSTHEAGGITELDTTLARAIDALAPR